MKYLKFKRRGFLLFEETQSHSEMARAIGDEVESAGFAHATDWCEGGKIVCSGGSTMLNLHATDDDTEMLRRRLSR